MRLIDSILKEIFVDDHNPPSMNKSMGRLENSIGIDPALFNCLFALISGHAASIAKSNWSNFISGKDQLWTQGLDPWDWKPGIQFFNWFLFDVGECPRFKKPVECCIICGREIEGFEGYHLNCEVVDD